MGIGMDLLFGGELEPVVDPRRQPAPIPRPEPYGAPQRQPQRTASPQRAPAQPQANAQALQPAVSDDWYNLLKQSGIEISQAATASQYIIDKTDNPDARYPSELPPGAKGNLDAYWEAYGRDGVLGARTQRDEDAKKRTMPQQQQTAPAEQPIQPATPAQAPAPAKPVSGMDLLFGGDDPQQATHAEQPRKDRQSNTGSWMTSAYNYMTGADRDPAYKDAGDFDTRQLLPVNPTDNTQFDPYRASQRAQLFGATDAQLGDVIELQLGDRFIRRFNDKDGLELVEYVGNDGQKRTEYINTPGIDSSDVGRFALGAVPYMTAARVAGALGGGFGAQTVVQGTAAGGTSVAGDVVNTEAGSKQGVDPFKALVTAGFAGGAQLTAPVVGFLWRRLVKEPQLFNSQTGKLTAKGAQAAQEAGIDPGQLTRVMARQFARDMAKTNNATEAGMRVIADTEFGVPTTLGQRTKSIPQLTDEGVLKYGGYGDDAAQRYQDFTRNQAQALEDAAIGQGTYQGLAQPNKASVMQTIAPEYATPGGIRKGEFGSDIRTAVQQAHEIGRAAENQAWDNVTELLPSPQALRTLPRALNTELGGRIINPRVTPVAHEMRVAIMDFIENQAAPREGHQIIGGEMVRSVDQMRRMLGEWMRGTRNDTDEAAASALYAGYNNWIRESAEAQLLAGSPQAAQNLFNAIDYSRTLNQIFRPNATGSDRAASRVIRNILDDAVTAEKLVDELFGAGTKGAPKAGTAEVLNSIRNGFVNLLPPDQARAGWNAIRAAYWSRIIKSKSGDLVGPQAMETNLKTAFEQQGSILNMLYNQSERAQMRRFLQMLDGVVAPNVNSSGSGFVGVAQARRGISQIVERFTGKFIADLFDRSLGGIIKGAQGSRSLSRAISQDPANSVIPTLGGYGGSVGSGIERQPTLDRNSQRVPVR